MTHDNGWTPDTCERIFREALVTGDRPNLSLMLGILDDIDPERAERLTALLPARGGARNESLTADRAVRNAYMNGYLDALNGAHPGPRYVANTACRTCGCPRLAHIYEVGACRPGYPCPSACEEYDAGVSR